MEIEAEYNILTKKIHSKFYNNSLFLYFVNTSWVGEIVSVGDVVAQEGTNIPIYIDNFINISRKRNPEMISDVVAVICFAEDIVLELKTKVETVIMAALNQERSKDGWQYKYKIGFASNIIKQGGCTFDDNDYYNFRLVYGFNIEKED